MKWQLLVGVGALASIGVAGLWLKERLQGEDGTPASEENRNVNAQEQQGKGASKPQAAADSVAQEKGFCKAELERFGNKFEDLYTPLRQVAEQSGYRVDEGDLAFSWDARLEDDGRMEHLYRKWQDLKGYSDREKLGKWYYFLLSLGVSYSTEQSVVLDEKAMKKYDFVDDWKPYIGQTLQVKAGYWYLGNTVLEKGILVVDAEA